VHDTGEGAGSVATSMAAVVNLINASAEFSPRRGNGNDLLDIGQSNSSHETIVLDHQWHAYSTAANGHPFG